MQILALLLFSLLSSSFAFPECSCANCTPAWGVKDPQTCSGLTISGYPNTCDFDPSNLQGTWYQLFEASGQGFLQGETCLEWNFEVSGEDLAVTIDGRNSDGTQAAVVSGSGSAYAIPSFPGKLQIVFTGYETYFPQLIVEEADNGVYYSSRPLYVVRNDPNNQWIILTDCNCENLFALARSPAPSPSIVSTIQDNYDTLGFGTSIVSVSQSCYTSTSTSSTTTSSTTSSTSESIVIVASTTTSTSTTSTGIPAPLTTAAIAPIASLTTSPNSPAPILSTAGAPVTPPASLTTAASVVAPTGTGRKSGAPVIEPIPATSSAPYGVGLTSSAPVYAPTGSAGAGSSSSTSSSTSSTSTGVPVVVSSTGSSTTSTGMAAASTTTSTGMAAASSTTSTGSASMMTTGTTSRSLNDSQDGNASLVNSPSNLLCGLLSVLLLVVAGMRS